MSEYIRFTEDMKKDYTILVPTMLPMHFKLIVSALSTYGYRMEVLDDFSREVVTTGLEHVHNDTCYPAILVIGQFLRALKSGRYDTHKTALILFQTGGGCRASNYIPLLRKALERAGMGYVPVISMSLSGVETHPGFRLSFGMMRAMLCAVLYGDLLMTLVNQLRPYEKQSGEAQRRADNWTQRLGAELGAGGGSGLAGMKRNYRAILEDFATVECEERDTVRVGIVGEIFVKYSPLGNNHLEDFLVGEGAEVDLPGLTDFCLYCIYNDIMDYKLYRRIPRSRYLATCALYRFFCGLKNGMIAAIRRHGRFRAPTPFEKIVGLSEKYLRLGAKMGEGWLLTSEMVELYNSGTKNIVCAQPFGCLPNHICGKGMMKPLRDDYPDMNIVAIDYDAGATRVNQENRLKLMLANARRNKQNG